MYLCLYLCMHSRMYLCMYLCTYLCLYLCMYLYMYLCLYLCMYSYTYLCLYSCMCLYMYLCLYLCTYLCIAFLKGPRISSSESSSRLGSSVTCASLHGLIGIASARPFPRLLLALRLVPVPIFCLALGRTVFDSQAASTPVQLGVRPADGMAAPTYVFTSRPRLWGEILSHGGTLGCGIAVRGCAVLVRGCGVVVWGWFSSTLCQCLLPACTCFFPQC